MNKFNELYEQQIKEGKTSKQDLEHIKKISKPTIDKTKLAIMTLVYDLMMSKGSHTSADVMDYLAKTFGEEFGETIEREVAKVEKIRNKAFKK